MEFLSEYNISYFSALWYHIKQETSECISKICLQITLHPPAIIVLITVSKLMLILKFFFSPTESKSVHMKRDCGNLQNLRSRSETRFKSACSIYCISIHNIFIKQVTWRRVFCSIYHFLITYACVEQDFFGSSTQLGQVKFSCFTCKLLMTFITQNFHLDLSFLIQTSSIA